MTTPTIQRQIARAIAIEQQLAGLEDELKQIKTALKDEAGGRYEEQTPTEGGGWSWRHADTEGHIVCVTQPAPKIKSKIDPEAATFAKIKEVAGRAFMALFMQVPAYRPVEDFRTKALAQLPQSDAKKLIKLVTTESSMQVAFEVAQKEAA